MMEQSQKEQEDRTRFLEQKLQENNDLVEKLCERDIVIQSLPYALSTFIEGSDLQEGLANIMNRLERGYDVSGAFLLSLDEKAGTGSLMAASSGAGLNMSEQAMALADTFPFQDLRKGFISSPLSSGHIFKNPLESLHNVDIVSISAPGRNSFFGCICIIYRDGPRQWEEIEKDTLRNTGTFIGFIVELNELKRSIEEDRDNLEKIVDERTAELKTLNTALRAEVTRRKKAQFALRNRHKILREMYNRVPVGAVIIRPDGSFDFSNHYFRFMTGYAKKELNQLFIKDLLSSTKGNCFDENGHFRSDIKDMGATITHNNDKETEVRISTFPLQNDPDQEGGTVCLFTDLSRKKEQEHRERLMKIQLTKLTLELDKLKSIISGDHKQPKSMDIDSFGLTKREKETLLFALQGYRTKEISRRMGVVEVTIRKNLTSIFRKLEVRDRYELIEKYRNLMFDKA